MACGHAQFGRLPVLVVSTWSLANAKVRCLLLYLPFLAPTPSALGAHQKELSKKGSRAFFSIPRCSTTYTWKKKPSEVGIASLFPDWPIHAAPWDQLFWLVNAHVGVVQ